MKMDLPVSRRAFGCLAAVWLALSGARALAADQPVVLLMKNGDRVTGVVLREDAETLTLSNAWAAALSLPLEAIERREPLEVAPTDPPVEVATDPQRPATPAATAQPLAPKRWNADVNFGLDAILGTQTSQNYFGSASLTYSVPYRQAPDLFFRAISRASGSYGESEGVISSAQVAGSLKTDFDLTRNFYAYNLGGAGYDTIRRIDLQWELGPGLGWRAVKRPKLALDFELGGQYVVRNLAVGPDTREVFLRFGENLAWGIGPRVTLKQTFAYLPQSDDFELFRIRFDSTVSFGILHNVSVNFGVVNLYDSNPAPGVDQNQLQFRSTIGVKF